MYTILLIFHAIFCILLVAIVLLQVGRGRGMMGFMGGGTADTLFGSRAGDVLTKSTTVIAVLFMVTSLSLAYISVTKGGSLMKGISLRKGAVATDETASSALPEDKFIQKGAGAVESLKQKLADKLPRLTKEKTKEKELVQPLHEEAGLVPTVTTKSKIRYDENGNKIVDELKYDSQDNLIGRTQITYDRSEKEIDRKELPLVEEKLEDIESSLPQE